MVTEHEYAELSNRVYDRSRVNRTPVPLEWTEVRWLSDAETNGTGFSAGVYQKGNEVVISFTGTNEGKVLDTLAANIPLGIGLSSMQLQQAIGLYLQTKAQHPDATISFTGHSLGGGLASVMAVFFNKEATIFDPAPFESSARSLTGIATAVATMGALGYSDADLLAYAQAGGAQFLSRETLVKAVSLEGEFLALLRLLPSSTIHGGSEKVVPIGEQTILDPSPIGSPIEYGKARFELHSMSLLAAMLRSKPFEEAVRANKNTIELFFDSLLYKNDRASNQANFIDKLLLSDMGNQASNIPARPVLDLFAADLRRLEGSAGMAAQPSMVRALTVAAMEYYYFKDPQLATQLFSVANNAIHFDYADVGEPLSGLKSPRWIAKALKGYLASDEWSFVGHRLESQDAWHIQSGEGGMTWTAAGPTRYDAAIGGASVDVIDSGAGDDILIGGAGQDFLNGAADNDTLLGGVAVDVLEGGAGNDFLLGGLDADTYVFSGSFGADILQDSDGKGIIQIDGATVTGAGALKVNDTTWQTEDRSLRYVLAQVSAGRTDLVITYLGSGNQITIQNWNSAERSFGITLSDAPFPSQEEATLNGEYGKAKELVVPDNGAPYWVYKFDASGLYESDGAAAGEADILFSQPGANTDEAFYGRAGNDGIAAGGGDDLLEGGEGADLLLGGFGTDTLQGGAGNDFIFGSGVGSFVLPQRVDFTPPEARGVELERGFSWVAFDPVENDANGVDTWELAGLSLQGWIVVDGVPTFEDTGNVIDAGTGNDRILAGSAADIARGGDDNDVIHGMALGDVLFGDAGDDSIWGDGAYGNYLSYTPLESHGNDVIVGGEGNDYAVGQGANDEVYGGIGNDSLFGDDNNRTDTPDSIHGADYLDGGDGDDQATGGGDSDTIFGGGGNDNLRGDDEEADVASSVHGADYVDGEAGDDYIEGGGGDDVLIGGDGADQMEGDDEQSDLAVSVHGDDYMDGGAGNDLMAGDGGADEMYGGAGDDQLEGDARPSDVDPVAHADDLLDGGDGNDLMYGGGGSDELFGGEGADSLWGDDEAAELAIEFHRADRLEGQAGDDQLSGGGGDDTLLGGDGSDYLVGDAGDDTLDGGADADILEGGAGNDTYRIAASESSTGLFRDTISDTSGSDKLVLDGVALSDLTVAHRPDDYLALGWGPDRSVLIEGGLTSSFQEVLVGGDSSTLRRLVNERVTTTVVESSARNSGVLLGGAAIDTLTVTHSGNEVSAGRGNDTIRLDTAGGATVSLSAGDGLDTIIAVQRDAADPLARNVLSLEPGIEGAALRIYRVSARDFVLAVNDAGDGVRFSAGDGSGTPIPAAEWPFDVIRLPDGSTIGWQEIVDRGIVQPPTPATSADDVRQLTPIADTYYGLDGNDSIEGLAGADTLSGDAGSDTLIGGAGNDVLYGGSGGNTLLGGDGADQLQGGSSDAYDIAEGGEGNDSYSFRLGSGISVGGEARDRSTTSDDLYTVSGYQIGGYLGQRWTISDDGGNDRLALNHSLVTAANTAVRYTGTGLSLTSWNLEVQLDGAVTPDGMVDPAKGIETVSFFDGTSWSATQMLAMTLQATGGDDSIHGYSGAEALDGGAGNDALWGGSGNDTLQGGAGGDTLRGEAGNDVLSAGADGGTLLGGDGDDSYRVSRGDGTVYLGAAQRGAAENDGVDTLQLDVVAGEVTFSIEQMPFNADEDYLVVRLNDGSATAKLLLEGGAANGLRGAVESIRFADGSSLSLASVLATAVPATTAGNDNLTYKSSDDVVAGGDGHDTLNGRAGNDRLDGDNGNDQLRGASGDDTLAGAAGNDWLDGGDGANTIEFGAGGGQDRAVAVENGSNALLLAGAIAPASVTVSWQSLTYQSNDSNPRAQWSAGMKIALAGGVDYVVSDVSNYVNFMHYDSSRFGVHSVQFTDGTRWDLQALVDAANRVTPGGDLLFDAAGRDLLAGGDGDDRLYGLDGANRLEGQSGNDTLFGRDSDDTLAGGTGDDVYFGDTGLNTIEYSPGDGSDAVASGGTTRVQFGVGIAAADVIVGHSTFGSLDLRVNGGGSLSIGLTSRSSGLDSIAFVDGTTWTAVQAWDLALGGTAGDDHIVGFDAADDTVSGAGGADTLEGGTGSDLLDGGAGDDVLYAAKYGDAGMPWYQDTLVGAGGNDTLVGATGAMTYRFDAGFGNDRIEWTAGRDLGQTAHVVFGAGIAPADIQVSRSAYGLVLSATSNGDTVHIANFFTAVDSTDLRGDRPIDRVEFDDGTVWSGADLVARLTQALTAADDLFYGSAGADTIDALAGHDRVYAGGGNDVVLGGAGDDLLRGDDGDDTLDGGSGWDDLDGGAGDDRFDFGLGDGSERVIDTAGAADVLAFRTGVAAADVQVLLGLPESAGQGYRLNLAGGVDTVYIAGIEQVQFDDGTQWSLAQIDAMARTRSGTAGNDVLSGTAQDDRLLGLAGNDTLNGLDGDDLLDGGAGNDSMAGGQGNDTYVVDSASDVVSEASGQGTDLVQAAVSYTLGSNVENLTLTGSASLNGTGNTLANVLTGNAGNNALSGGTGADTLIGGAGNDTYTVDNAGDAVSELAAEGIDLVQSSVSYTLAAEVENLTLTGSSGLSGTGNALDNLLTGNSGANTLSGGAGNDRLNGGSGNDTMIGGSGDDTYVVNVSGDVVTELAGEGIDTIESSVTLTLGSGNTVEHLTLTGSSAVNATGNSLDNRLTGNGAKNTLTGNAGNDTLDGGAGTDTMRGGAGDDTYVVERSADVTTENANEGIDTVLSAVTRTLGSNLEHLTLTGSGAINGTGNTLANLLTGNGGANTLAGLAGDDTYDGGAGNDALTDNSTSSADTYRFGIGYGVDTITDSGGADTVQFGAGLTAGDLVFSHVGNNIEITIAGHGADKLVVANHYVGTASKIETFRLSDGTTLPPAVVPLSSGARGAAALNEPEPVAALREHIMPVRPIRSSIAAAAAPETTVAPGRGRAYAPPWQPATLRDLDWPALAITEVPIASALIARQAQSLVSAMAAFGGEHAAFDSERPTVLPVHRPEPMWVSPAVM